MTWSDIGHITGLSTMLPASLTAAAYSGENHTMVKKNVTRLRGFISDFVRTSWANPQSKRMLIFFLVNMCFMFVEMGVGVYVNSLGLISDAFHMLSDCFSIFVALVAAYISTGEADRVNTYGYRRVEILTGFFNGVFLAFVAINVFCESI